MVKSYDEYLEDAKKRTDKYREKDIKSVEDSANKSISQINDTYNKTIDDTKVSYESEYERNAVQKLINERAIAEKNANLGLTDSGLNRTQQTATQLAYSNQKGDIDLARQKAIDTLNSNLAYAINEINAQLEADKRQINNNYDSKNAEIATSLYNTDVEDERIRWIEKYNADLELEKARIEAERLNKEREYALLQAAQTNSKSDGGGTDIPKDNNNTDKSKTSPLTNGGGSYNFESKTSDAQVYGTFSNGYQPKGIVGYGKLSKTGLTIGMVPSVAGTGLPKDQNIWKAGDAFFIWDGSLKQYRILDKELGKDTKSMYRKSKVTGVPKKVVKK